MEIQKEHSQEIQVPRFRDDSNQNESLKLVDAKVFLRKRYLVTLFVLMDWIVLYLMRMNLSISIVDMTANKTVTIGNETFVKEAEFHWSSKEKGVLLSAFSLGYMTAPLGAVATNKCGSILTFTIATAGTGCLTILSPLVLSWSTSVYLVVRVMEGIFEGLAITSVMEVLRLWSIPSERNRIYSAIPTGFALGTMLGFPVCGTIIHLLNWRAVFYITGGLSLVWSIIWFSLVNTPEKDNFITTKERSFIQAANKCSSNQKITYPWKEIFKSKAVWAYWNERFVEAWSATFLIYCLPLYIKDFHDVDIQDIGLICGIPHLCGIAGLIGGSTLADFLRTRGILSISNVHKLYLSFSHVVAIVLLVAAALWRDFVANIIIFSIFRLCFNLACLSYMVLPVEMTGQYGPLIQGLGTMGFGFGAFLCPIVMGLIVSNHSPFEWSIYFAVLSSFNFWGAIVFYKYGSANLQPWAILPDNTAVRDTENGKGISTSNTA